MKHIITGLVIIIAGVIALLANIDAFGVREILANWWPVGLIIAGLLIYANNTREYGWAIVWVVAGVMFLMNTLNIVSINIGDLVVPAILVGIGVSVALRARGVSRRQTTQQDRDEMVAVLSGISQRNNATDLEKIRATAIMGGIELDLSKAVIKKEASIETLVVMGGIELRVPENVVVKSRALVILGGIEDKTNPIESKNAPVLYIDGNVMLGGIEVKR